jgi:dihydrofolate reductase
MTDFKALTSGGVIVMGRKTWELVGDLPGRFTIVLTRDPASVPSETHRVARASLVSAVSTALSASGSDRVYVCGGRQVYEQALARKVAGWLRLSVIRDGEYVSERCPDDVRMPEPAGLADTLLIHSSENAEFSVYTYYLR